MENDETPRGQRITRLCFSLVSQGASRDAPADPYELVIGLTASYERIHSMWCEITSDFMTITMMVTPRGHEANMAQTVVDLTALVTKGPTEAAKKRGKKGASHSTPEDAQEAEIAEADAILLRMISELDRIERRQKIYKVSEITGPIDLFSYIEPANIKDFSVRNAPESLQETK